MYPGVVGDIGGGVMAGLTDEEKLSIFAWGAETAILNGGILVKCLKRAQTTNKCIINEWIFE